MHKRAINCELCHQQFFPASMKFHLKSCAIKNSFIEMPCYYCQKPFQKQELQSHIEKCNIRIKQEKNNKVTMQISAGLKEQPNQMINVEEYYKSGLIPCKVCKRTFANDRILKHQNICIKISQKRNVFDSKKQRLPEEIQKIKSYKYQPLQNNKRNSVNNFVNQKQQKWKIESEKFRQMLKDAREYKKIAQSQQVKSNKKSIDNYALQQEKMIFGQNNKFSSNSYNSILNKQNQQLKNIKQSNSKLYQRTKQNDIEKFDLTISLKVLTQNKQTDMKSQIYKRNNQQYQQQSDNLQKGLQKIDQKILFSNQTSQDNPFYFKPK